VADEVLRHSQTPVLLVPPHGERAWPTDRPLRVLVPLDGSALAEEALTTAELVAGAFGAELMLLRVVEPPVYPLYGDGYAYIPFDEDAELADAERYLQTQALRLRAAGTTTRTRTAIGQPSTVLAAVARDEQADVIAMATHGRGGLARLVMGSVATGALQRATVPLLLTRPAALARPIPRLHGAAAPVATPPVAVTLNAGEAQVVRLALESFLADTRGEEHVSQPVRDVLRKLRSAEATVEVDGTAR
jgi:nucleotide-binding universal stress UspA family protein